MNDIISLICRQKKSMPTSVAQLQTETVLDARIAHSPVNRATGCDSDKVPDRANVVAGTMSGKECSIAFLGNTNEVIDIRIILAKVTPREQD